MTALQLYVMVALAVVGAGLIVLRWPPRGTDARVLVASGFCLAAVALFVWAELYVLALVEALALIVLLVREVGRGN